MGHRKPMVAGNWKMNLDRAAAVALARAVAEGAAGLAREVECAVCPPFVYLEAVRAAMAPVDAASRPALGAQDLWHEANGAFTGEVSASMLLDCGATIVLTGHSERRHVLGEGDELVAKKTRAALAAGLRCIVCVGELLDERERGETDRVNERQVRAALQGLGSAALGRTIIAYEPVWAIGTGRTATPADAQQAHERIRRVVSSMFGAEQAEIMPILYGGSVKPDNARGLFDQPDIDGGLIGGASLKAADFLAIVAAARRG